MGIASILNGWALSVLWGWFFVPTLGLPELGIVQAIGIAMVVGYLTYQHIDTQPKDGEAMGKIVSAVIQSVARPVFAVTFGWVVHSFM
jgi:hypothetical protein